MDTHRINRTEQLYRTRLAEVLQRRADLTELTTQVDGLRERDTLLKHTEAAIGTLTTMVYSETVDTLTATLNYGIQAAYPRQVEAVVEKGISGGKPTLKIGLLDGGTDPVSPDSAHGGGLAQILGFLARVILVMATGKRRVLVLDEAFSAVSIDLLPSVSNLLRTIVEDLGFQIVLVTHQPALADYAHSVYRVEKPGTIEQVSIGEL